MQQNISTMIKTDGKPMATCSLQESFFCSPLIFLLQVLNVHYWRALAPSDLAPLWSSCMTQLKKDALYSTLMHNDFNFHYANCECSFNKLSEDFQCKWKCLKWLSKNPHIFLCPFWLEVNTSQGSLHFQRWQSREGPGSISECNGFVPRENVRLSVQTILTTHGWWVSLEILMK